MKKYQVDFVVKYILKKIGYCHHEPLRDCGKCIEKWIREGIRKSESEIRAGNDTRIAHPKGFGCKPWCKHTEKGEK